MLLSLHPVAISHRKVSLSRVVTNAVLWCARHLRSSTCCSLLKHCWPSSYQTSRRGFAQPLPRSSTRRGMPGWSRCAHTFGTVIEAIQSYYVHVGSSYWTTVIITHSDMDDLWRFPQRLLDAKAKKRCKAPKLPVETIEPSVVQPEPAVNVDDVTVSWRHWPLAWISPPQPHPYVDVTMPWSYFYSYSHCFTVIYCTWMYGQILWFCCVIAINCLMTLYEHKRTFSKHGT